MSVDLLRLLSRSDINTVIMDYLIKEGYPDSARKFALEANIKQKPEDDSIRARVLIRNAIHSGDIQTAIEHINELNPEVCDFRVLLPFFFCYDYISSTCTTHSLRVLMKNNYTLQSSV